MRLGEVRVRVLHDGAFALDGGAMFGVVPRVLWEKTDPPDEQNRVALGLNVALIETAGKRILVDTGMGDKWTEKETALFRLDRAQTLLGSLAALGLGPGDIDLVVNTHLHFDHAGGNTRLDDGKVVPTFPRARYLVQMGEWEDATHPHERNRASYREHNFIPIAEARQLETVQGEVEIAPGVRVMPVGGHTAYHQMVLVEGGGKTLAIPTDLLPTTSHVPLPFIMGYDLFPVGTLEAKRRLLKSAVEEGWMVLFYHDARTPLGKVREENGRYLLDQRRRERPRTSARRRA
ncbi:MAG TPA: MBL fold metallo-hydrolase [Vicinamibacteria bacterium]|nr:MBL fold metallo-hydrolase [Vicinamibacteria bacterium]